MNERQAPLSKAAEEAPGPGAHHHPAEEAPTPGARPHPAPGAHHHPAVEKLARALRYETVSHSDLSLREEAPLEEWEGFIADAFPTVHGRLERAKPVSLAIIYKWEGRDTSLLAGALLAHYDVVPPGDHRSWHYPPFSGTIAEGYIWGRGAIDDKAADIGILQAVEELLLEGFQPERTLYLCFGGDEEIGGSEGARSIVGWIKERGERLAWVLDEGGMIVEEMMPGLDAPAAVVGLAEKGHINVKITAPGRGGHASTPPAETAVSRLATAIRKILGKPFPRRLTPTVDAFLDALGRELTGLKGLIFRLRPATNPLILTLLSRGSQTAAMLRTTQAVTMVSGGSAENVLPHSASAIVNIRLLHGDSISGAVEHLREAIADPEIEVELHGEWSNTPAVEETPPDHPLLSIIAKGVAEIAPNASVIPYLMTGSTDSATYADVTENIFRFLPLLLTGEELSRMHSANERISLENVERAVIFYRGFLRRAARRESNRE